MKYKNYTPDIYIADTTRNLRFALGNKGQKPLICIGINPNKANNEVSDSTMNGLVELCQEKGYDSCIMLNPYPLICADPASLPPIFDKEISAENNLVVKEFFETYSGCDVLVMWGDFITKNYDFMKNVISILDAGIDNKMCFKCLRKLSRSGNPYHLQYILRSYNTDHKNGKMTQKYELIDFDATKYLHVLLEKASQL